MTKSGLAVPSSLIDLPHSSAPTVEIGRLDASYWVAWAVCIPEGGLRAFKDRLSARRVAQRAKVFDEALRAVSRHPDVLDSFLMRRFLKQNFAV